MICLSLIDLMWTFLSNLIRLLNSLCIMIMIHSKKIQQDAFFKLISLCIIEYYTNVLIIKNKVIIDSFIHNF